MLEHRYGPQVRILNDPWSLTALARLCAPGPGDLQFHELLSSCYRQLLHAACAELPAVELAQPTRMAAGEPRAVLTGPAIDPNHAIAVVDIARGGMIPAHVVQRELLAICTPEAVRVDHLYMQRVSDAGGHVVGVATAGSKIGGSIEGATLLIPDPMGATGVSVSEAIALYRALGRPRRIVTLHLIVTPEYLRRLTREPDVVVYALRVDRGLSAPDVLREVPGARWSEERGLDGHDYIVPGAGGLGELINNVQV